jgi:hypothetical protein
VSSSDDQPADATNAVSVPVSQDELDDALSSLEFWERRRMRRWRLLPDGSLRVFLGSTQLLPIAAAGVVVFFMVLTVRSLPDTRPPVSAIILVIDALAFVVLVWNAVRWPAYAVVSGSELYVTPWIGRSSLPLDKVRSMETVVQTFTRTRHGRRYHFVRPIVHIDTDDSRWRFQFATLREGLYFSGAIAQRCSGLEHQVRWSVSGADGAPQSPAPKTTLVAGPWLQHAGRLLALGLGLMIAAFSYATTSGEFEPERREVEFGSVMSSAERDIARLSALDSVVPDVEVEAAYRRCGTRWPGRLQVTSWRIDVRAEQPDTQSEAWQDAVVERLNGVAGVSIVGRPGYDIALSTSGDSRAVVIYTDCIVATSAQRDQVFDALSDIARRSLALI